MMFYFVAETDSPGYRLRFGMPLACIHAIVALLPIVYFRSVLSMIIWFITCLHLELSIFHLTTMMFYFVAETDSPGYKLRFGMPLACIHAIVTLLPIVYFRSEPLFSESIRVCTAKTRIGSHLYWFLSSGSI